MLASRRRFAALAVAGLLAAPAPALGQSAGDDQYEDPFAGENQQEQPSPDTPVDDGGGSAQPAPAPAEPAPAPATTGQEPASMEAGPATASQERLPNTGADAGAVVLAGTILLAGGFVLRLRLRERS